MFEPAKDKSVCLKVGRMLVCSEDVKPNDMVYGCNVTNMH